MSDLFSGSQSLVLLQSSISQSVFPVLRNYIRSTRAQRMLLCCLLYNPSDLSETINDNVQICNLLDNIPSYNTEPLDSGHIILDTISQVPNGVSLDVVIDDVDTLLSTISVSETCIFLRRILDQLAFRPDPSRLILHVHAPSRLISPLTEVYFSRFVTHVIAHPISLFAHLATEFNLPPPPASDEAKFWNIFIPLRERYHGVSSVIYGSNGKGNGSESEFVLEVISRGKEGTGKRKAVSRNLHGWDKALQKCCELNNLNGLLPYFKPKVHTSTPDPTQNATFNLRLTTGQEESRSNVPLPYAHGADSSQTASAIYYDPDSADDIDDDDPDEDLDI